jgi:hypothetical protein
MNDEKINMSVEEKKAILKSLVFAFQVTNDLFSLEERIIKYDENDVFPIENKSNHKIYKDVRTALARIAIFLSNFWIKNDDEFICKIENDEDFEKMICYLHSIDICKCHTSTSS